MFLNCINSLCFFHFSPYQSLFINIHQLIERICTLTGGCWQSHVETTRKQKNARKLERYKDRVRERRESEREREDKKERKLEAISTLIILPTAQNVKSCVGEGDQSADESFSWSLARSLIAVRWDASMTSCKCERVKQIDMV